MMAGEALSQLLEAMQSAAGQPSPSGQELASGQQPGSESSNPSQQPSAASDTGEGGSSQPGGETQNGELKQGALEEAEAVSRDGTKPSRSRRDGDANGLPRRNRQPAWFAKLPPELRNAIRSNAQQRAPRAYEERLRRYFESLEDVD